MELSLSCNDLADYVAGQCNAFFPDKHVLFGKDFSQGLRLALERIEYCFSLIRLRGYGEGRQARFHHLHALPGHGVDGGDVVFRWSQKRICCEYVLKAEGRHDAKFRLYLYAEQ